MITLSSPVTLIFELGGKEIAVQTCFIPTPLEGVHWEGTRYTVTNHFYLLSLEDIKIKVGLVAGSGAASRS